MPRIRTIKPEAFLHRKIGRLSDRAFRLWVGMICHADDEGRLVSEPEQLRAMLFGYQHETTADHIKTALSELSDVGLISLYEIAGVSYGYFPSWTDHQKIDHPSRSKLPAYPKIRRSLARARETSRGLGEASRTLALDQGSRKGSRIKEGIKETREGSRALDESPTPTTPLQNSLNGRKPAFVINETILAALDRAPQLGAVKRLRTPQFWQAQFRANPGVDWSAEIFKAEAYLVAHPERHYKRLEGFFHSWLGRADRVGR